MGAVKALYFTPIRLPTTAKMATLELVGIKLTGAKVSYEVKLNIASGKKQLVSWCSICFRGLISVL